MSVCRQMFFQIATLTVFVLFSRNLAHMIYVPVCKTVEQIFRVVILKILAHLKKILDQHLGQQASSSKF